jgi:hypothetical protein
LWDDFSAHIAVWTRCIPECPVKYKLFLRWEKGEFSYSYTTDYKSNWENPTDVPVVITPFEKCVPCHDPFCDDCSSDINKCDLCAFPYYLNPITKLCAKTCPPTHLGRFDKEKYTIIRRGTCHLCADSFPALFNCEQCLSGKWCTVCRAGFILGINYVRKTSLCQKNCPRFHYLENKSVSAEKQKWFDPKNTICKKCMPGCDYCKSDGVCDQCICNSEECWHQVYYSETKKVCEKTCGSTDAKFLTLDNSCLSCDSYILGCSGCTNDKKTVCISSKTRTEFFTEQHRKIIGLDVAYTPGCDYKTECTKCVRGFWLEKDHCCKIPNCKVCSNLDATRCLQCKPSLMILAQEHYQHESAELFKKNVMAIPGTGLDHCIKKAECLGIHEYKDRGFYIKRVWNTELNVEVAYCLPCKIGCLECESEDVCTKCITFKTHPHPKTRTRHP